MTIHYDTMQAAHSLNEEIRVSLENLAGIELGVESWGKGKIDFGEVVGPKAKPPSPLDGEDGMLYYCGRDTAYTHMLYELQRERVMERQELAKLLRYLVLPGLAAITQMELNGIYLDVDKVRDRIDILRERRDSLQATVLSYVPEPFRDTADLNSLQFLRRWLFGSPPDGLGFEPIDVTATGQAKIDEATLRKFEHDAVVALIEWRDSTKQLQFVEQWIELVTPESRVHPYYRTTGTVTGRRSCERPNLQQVPRDPLLRGCYGAPPGKVFLEVDYAQLEVRIAAWLSGDAELLRLFNEGRDPYRETASYILKIKSDEVSKEDRQKGKAAVLGFQYGMGEFAFQRYADETFGVKLTKQEAAEFRNMFFSLFPDLLRWHEYQRRIVGRYGKVTSPFGRTRHLERVRSNDRVEVGKAERQAINAPVQGLGGDLTLASMVTLSRILDNSRALIVGDVHDALLFELDASTWKEDAETILHTFENPPLFEKFGIECPVHLKAEGKVGQYWGEGFEFTLEDLRAGLVPEPFQAA